MLTERRAGSRGKADRNLAGHLPWRDKCIIAGEGGAKMNTVISVETAICSEHQRLLAECERALETWNEHRAEYCKSHPITKKAGDELLRLQANYARAYTVLTRHEHNCSLCQWASRASEHDSAITSDTYFESIV